VKKVVKKDGFYTTHPLFKAYRIVSRHTGNSIHWLGFEKRFVVLRCKLSTSVKGLLLFIDDGKFSSQKN
jgi:hypothetical protein